MIQYRWYSQDKVDKAFRMAMFYLKVQSCMQFHGATTFSCGVYRVSVGGPMMRRRQGFW